MFQTYILYNAEESENRKSNCFNTIVDATVELFLLFLSTILRALYFIFVCVCVSGFFYFVFIFFLLLLYEPKTFAKKHWTGNEPLGSLLKFELIELRTIIMKNYQTIFLLNKCHFKITIKEPKTIDKKQKKDGYRPLQCIKLK